MESNIRTQLMDLILDLPTMEKDGLNTHHGNKYITLDQIINKLKPLMKKHRICITHDVLSDTVPESVSMQVTVKVIAWNEAGDRLEGSPMSAVCAQNVQQIGSAITYLKRYSLAAFLGISADEDDDGNTIAKAKNMPVKVAAPKTTAKAVPAAMLPSQKEEITKLKTEIFAGNTKGALQYISDSIGRPAGKLDLTPEEAEKAINALWLLSGRPRGTQMPTEKAELVSLASAKIDKMYLETIESTWSFVKGIGEPMLIQLFRERLNSFRPRPKGEWDNGQV